jgi:hypothetical protein
VPKPTAKPELHTFTTGIRQDAATATAGLTLPYNSSGPRRRQRQPDQGDQRQMYGRASLDLVRKRVIHNESGRQGPKEPTCGRTA